MKPKHDKSNGNDSDTDAEDNNRYDSNSSRSRSRSRSRKSTEKSSKSDKVDHDLLSIYIGNVDYSATEEELRDMFIGCGDIIRVTIIKNMRTGHSKGAAFIEFTDKDGVNAAMQLNGKELKGRPLIITSKKPRPEKRSSSTRLPSTRQYSQHSSSRSSRDYDYDYSSRSSRSGNGGPSGRPMPRRLPPMMPPMRSMQPRYDPYRRPPPEFYADPYMMQRPGPPMYHSKMHGRPPMASRPPPRYHPYSYRK